MWAREKSEAGGDLIWGAAPAIRFGCSIGGKMVGGGTTRIGMNIHVN
jgi:hypothetical protein